jgi:hypothetical protein
VQDKYLFERAGGVLGVDRETPGYIVREECKRTRMRVKVKSKCETILKRFGSFSDVVSNNKILYATPFSGNWAFLIAPGGLKTLALRSCFNLVPRAIRKAQFTQKLAA